MAKSKMSDEEAIRRTVAEYCQLDDDQRFDEFEQIWTDDATFRVRDIVHKGRHNVRAFIEGLALRRPQGVPRGIHGTFAPIIEINGNTAEARVDYIWFGLSDLSDGELKVGSGGRYIFRMVRNPDRWRITELEVRLLRTPEEDAKRALKRRTKEEVTGTKK